ncbi:ERMES complex subunit [Basidiobolus ranarum]|uniref:Mitochondrial distribution and morphology protein 34 n=1 Tax=Basidiobolus ranarum TaxID=34480 RepID=A0ABR2VZI1_9FUNG
MAFRFNWTEFNNDFLEEAKKLMTVALNKGSKPANIVGRIEVKELNLGTKPPELEILEIGELAEDKFRGIFKLVYSGDAYVALQTQVQANPINAMQNESIFGSIGSRWDILAAGQPLVVPMLISLRNLRLRGIIVLVIDKHKGVTLVFKNDPLENVEVSSTFDEVPAIRNFLQREIETQMRKIMQEEMPTIVHELSLKYLNKNKHNSESANAEEPITPSPLDTQSLPDLTTDVRRSRYRSYSSYSSESDNWSATSLSIGTCPTRWRGNDDFSDEGYESGYLTPTAEACHSLSGLHQEQGLKKLFNSEGLFNPKPRPLIYHSHSLCGTPNGRPRLSSISSTMSLPAFLEPEKYPEGKFSRGTTRKRRVKYSAPPCEVQKEVTTPYTAPTSPTLKQEFDYFNGNHHSNYVAEEQEEEVVLQPSDNAVAAQLASLMNSNHTISPYTRIFEHLTYRSSPQFAKVVNSPTKRRPNTKGGVKRNVHKFSMQLSINP